MKWNILHESRGRIRLHLRKPRMSLAEADQLQDYLTNLPGVRTAAVYERTCDVVIVYTESRAGVVRGLAAFRFDTEALAEVPANSPRAVNREYQEKLVNMTIFHLARKLFLPAPLRMVYTLVRSVPYIFRGLRCVFRRKLEVEVLDALSIGVSMLRGDFGTAGSVMFLLRLGELLEEWTRKKSLGDLARCMSLNVDRVWQQTAEGEVLVPISQVCAGDAIVVHTGSVIPLDGRVLDGEASVNQASLTGEAEPVRKSEGAVVYAGTVVEEGQITVTVEQQAGNGRYDQIVKMIENSEKLKSASETRAAALADKLVPYSLLGTAVTYALTRNATRAISILMVDFSCALKLSMPLAVLSAVQAFVLWCYFHTLLAPELVSRILLTSLPWYLAGLALYPLAAWVCLEPTWRRRVADILVAVGVCRLFFLSETPQAYDGMLPWLLALLLCVLFFPLLSVYRFKQGCQD